MKKIIFYICVFISTNLFSQVGVNTEEPTRSLDINGDLRVRELEKVSIIDYPDVLVTDKDGNIEKHSAKAIIDAISDLTVETKELYFETAPDGSKKVPCGRFVFRFSENTKPQMSSVSNLTASTDIHYMSQLKFNINNNDKIKFDVLSTSEKIESVDEFVDLDINYASNSVGEYYMSYPGDDDFYRIVFLARKMAKDKNSKDVYSYSIICEKF